MLGAPAVAGWHLSFRFGSLNTSRTFRRRYDSLRGYLSACRTDHLLRELNRAGETLRHGEPEALRAGWAASTASGTSATCRCPAAVPSSSPPAASPIAGAHVGPGSGHGSGGTARAGSPATEELEGLRDRIEQWALGSLFVTERPRGFFLVPLPRLMLLYSAYPGIGCARTTRRRSDPAPGRGEQGRTGRSDQRRAVRPGAVPGPVPAAWRSGWLSSGTAPAPEPERLPRNLEALPCPPAS